MSIFELLTTCRIVRVTPQLLSTCGEFSCGDADLDEFFSEDYEFFRKKLAAYNGEIKMKVDAMVEKRKVANRMTDLYEKAMAYYAIAESLTAIRKPIDMLEEIVDDNVWPMPKYRELLWIR